MALLPQPKAGDTQRVETSVPSVARRVDAAGGGSPLRGNARRSVRVHGQPLLCLFLAAPLLQPCRTQSVVQHDALAGQGRRPRQRVLLYAAPGGRRPRRALLRHLRRRHRYAPCQPPPQHTYGDMGKRRLRYGPERQRGAQPDASEPRRCPLRQLPCQQLPHRPRTCVAAQRLAGHAHHIAHEDARQVPRAARPSLHPWPLRLHGALLLRRRHRLHQHARLPARDWLHLRRGQRALRRQPT